MVSQASKVKSHYLDEIIYLFIYLFTNCYFGFLHLESDKVTINEFCVAERDRYKNYKKS